ncbi:MAG: tetratricopeptide repeat protein [Spirochaetales bacterium]|nr:tetratricopeptide repeat protein [Leptospiraceae bacterium]MCP5480203.1 tetratricopeptide repeat protein [Spirochaetales bacterium]MCP5486398.1 tetratricopeptide repeat protein [Spirochaetales bacterium]
MPSGRNRFSLDAPAERPVKFAHADDPESVGYSGETIYIDEPERTYRRRFGLRLFMGAGLLLLLLAVGAAVFYYFRYYAPGSEDTADGGQGFERVEQVFQDRYYLPSGEFSDEFNRAVALYRDYETHRAQALFEGILTSSAADSEKAAALVYLALMNIRTERFDRARLLLTRALEFDSESVPALVNLAILERRLGNQQEAERLALKARQLAPGNAEVQLLLGNIYAEGQDPGQAIAAYEEGIASNPDDPFFYYNKALVLMRTERYEEAILNFSKAIQVAGAGSVAVQSHAHLGQIYFNQNNLELAADHLSQAVRLAPDNGKYHYNLGVVRLRMNQNDRALRSFEQALQAGTNEALVYRALARAFERLNQPTLAIRALEKALYMNPNDIDSLFAQAELFRRQNDLLGAAEAYKRIVNITPGDTNTQEALIALSGIYMQMERHNDAIDMLERAEQLRPGNPRVYYELGLVYDRAGRRGLAIETWRRALSTPRDRAVEPLTRDQEREIRLALADVYRREGGYELALQQYRVVRERNQEPPARVEDPELDYEIAMTYMSLMDYRNAVASLDQVIEARSTPVEMRRDALLQRAVAYGRIGGQANVEQARTSINQAVRLDPLDQQARLVQASIMMETGSMVDREKAIEILVAVTRSDVPADLASKAHNLLGLAYMQNGEYREALASFDAAVQLDPSNAEAYQNQRVAANAYESSL